MTETIFTIYAIIFTIGFPICCWQLFFAKTSIFNPRNTINDN